MRVLLLARVPVLLGGAALSRHYCESHLRSIYDGPLYYGKDAFDGLRICDLIAEGIIEAVKQVGLTIPVIARLEGTNVEQGRKLLEESDFDIIPAVDLTDAAKKVVEAAK